MCNALSMSSTHQLLHPHSLLKVVQEEQRCDIMNSVRTRSPVMLTGCKSMLMFSMDCPRTLALNVNFCTLQLSCLQGPWDHFIRGEFALGWLLDQSFFIDYGLYSKLHHETQSSTHCVTAG
jgi:hypothetical protein